MWRKRCRDCDEREGWLIEVDMIGYVESVR